MATSSTYLTVSDVGYGRASQTHVFAFVRVGDCHLVTAWFEIDRGVDAERISLDGKGKVEYALDVVASQARQQVSPNAEHRATHSSIHVRLR